MNRLSLYIFISALLTSDAIADTWDFAARKWDELYTFGATHITLTGDTTKNQQYPAYTLTIITDNQPMAVYKGIAFSFLFADKNNQTFVGLSNTGLPGTAVVIFTSEGEIKTLINHGEFVPDYCEESVTLTKEWVDTDNPDVKFSYKKIGENYEYIDSITLIDCHGKRISLFDSIHKGQENLINMLKAEDQIEEENQ